MFSPYFYLSLTDCQHFQLPGGYFSFVKMKTLLFNFQVTWYKDGKELRSNDHISLQYSHGVCSLEIVSAKPEDTGVYRCYAVNELGEHETSSKVVVEGKKFGDLYLSVEPRREKNCLRGVYDLATS